MRVYPLLFLACAAVACNKATTGTDAAATETVTAGETTFVPNNVVIREGGVVRFTFGGTAHSVIFTEQSGRPENIEVAVANTTEERTFPVVGTYSYACADHSGSMAGTVTVRPVTSPPPPP